MVWKKKIRGVHPLGLIPPKRAQLIEFIRCPFPTSRPSCLLPVSYTRKYRAELELPVSDRVHFTVKYDKCRRAILKVSSRAQSSTQAVYRRTLFMPAGKFWRWYQQFGRGLHLLPSNHVSTLS